MATQNKIFCIFLKKAFLIFQENGTLKKLLIFQEVTMRAQKMKQPTLKKLLIFQEMELFNLKLKKILIYQEGTLKFQA